MQIKPTHSRFIILDIIKKEGRISSVQLRRKVDLSDNTISDYLRHLHEENKIYVVDWCRDKRNCARPVYAAGNKPDVEKPPVKGKYVPKYKNKEVEVFKPRRDEAAEWMTHL